MALKWILSATALLAFSGVPGLFWDKRSLTGQKLATALAIVGGLAGLVGTGFVLIAGEHGQIILPWFFPLGRFSVMIDALGAIFLAPIFVMPALGSIYGLSYWSQADHPENGRKLRLFYGLFAASMAMVVLARDGILFLIVWEIMALSAYFTATTDDEDPAVCYSGWIYLVATHMGTLCLIAMFVLMRQITGSFALEPVAANAMTTTMMTAVFLLAVTGFGFKAGLMPLHVWLPGAHANAPSHISAMMSGVMIKMGIYGIVRIIGLLPHPPVWWGGLLLAAGAVSGVMGIIFAIGQHDLKRLLAYSSIENIGVIVMGLGLAMLGRSMERTDWIVLGLGGALLHVWNHSMFKSLLFLGAGVVIHATHTRLMDRLGGLAKLMPRTFVLFAIGAGAICALPPLNGFVSEFLIYVGLFRTVGIGNGVSWPTAAFAVPALAMIGALSALCFLKLLGTVFLGQARSEQTMLAHDPDICMAGPMIFLATCCWVVGLVPWTVVPFLDRAVADWLPDRIAGVEPLGKIMPLEWVTVLGFVLVAMVVLGIVAVGRLYARRVVGSVGTWDCGYARPSARIQYTGSSLSQMAMELFSWAVWPKVHLPQLARLFLKPEHFKSYIPDVALDRLVLPGFAFAARFLAWLRAISRGRIQADLLYIFLIVVTLFLCG